MSSGFGPHSHRNFAFEAVGHRQATGLYSQTAPPTGHNTWPAGRPGRCWRPPVRRCSQSRLSQGRTEPPGCRRGHSFAAG